MSTQTTTAKDSKIISQFDISRLAHEFWQADGCPQGRDLEYWLKAEKQLNRNGFALASRSQPSAIVQTERKTVKSRKR